MGQNALSKSHPLQTQRQLFWARAGQWQPNSTFTQNPRVECCQTQAFGLPPRSPPAGDQQSPEAPVKFTITRDGGTLFFQPPGQSAVALEATAQDKFRIEGAVVIEFDAAKNQMILKRRGGERVFRKEK